RSRFVLSKASPVPARGSVARAAPGGKRASRCHEQGPSHYNESGFPPIQQELPMRRRVLIAEDSEPIREQLRKLLQADDSFEVETTGDGRSALELLTSQNYSIFLTDLRMPGLDGMQLVEQIRARKLPVIVVVMTGFGSIDGAVKAMRLGAYD